MATEYRIVIEREDGDGEWRPLHTGLWYADPSPRQEAIGFAAASMESMAVDLGLLTKRVVREPSDDETDDEEYEVTQLFTTDGSRARFSVYLRPAPADQPGRGSGEG